MLSAAWLRQAPAAAGKEDRPARQAPPWRLTAALASALLAALLGGGGAPEPAGPAAGGPRGDAPDAGALSDHAFLRERVMEDHGWPGPRADGAIAEYLRFLQLLASAPRMELVASDDRIWCGTSTCWTRRTTRPTPSASSAASCTIAGRVPLRRSRGTPQEVSDIPAGYARTKEARGPWRGRAAPTATAAPRTAPHRRRGTPTSPARTRGPPAERCCSLQRRRPPGGGRCRFTRQRAGAAREGFSRLGMRLSSSTSSGAFQGLPGSPRAAAAASRSESMVPRRLEPVSGD
ncbi:unnamed protein product [Prorocentrum cordatum]|uniref:C1q domain-containing protein n=1 Tax=Prorocentrum cordatum TaxID=2364126 RepID=A0ABN9VD74_9DINO|nr:unnamed protein product [Polarella glacialis]